MSRDILFRGKDIVGHWYEGVFYGQILGNVHEGEQG